MIIRTLGVLPDTLCDRLRKAGFTIVPIKESMQQQGTKRGAPVLVGKNPEAERVAELCEHALLIGLAENGTRMSGYRGPEPDVTLSLANEDHVAATLKKLVCGLSDAGVRTPGDGWILVRESGSVAACSPSAARLLNGYHTGSPFKLEEHQLDQLKEGSPVGLNRALSLVPAAESKSRHEQLLLLSSERSAGPDAGAISHPALECLPGVMLSGSMESCAEGLLEVMGQVLSNRPMAVMIGTELRTQATRNIGPDRAGELAELLCNFNVRSILQEHAIPLAGEQVVVIPPAVALRLGSYPVESTDGMMPNLLVVQLRDPGDRLAGVVVVELPGDRLPEPEQVQVLKSMNRYAAVAVRWQEVIAASADSVSLLESLIEYDPSGVAVLDDGGRIRKVNRSLQKLTGYRRDELVGRTLNRVFMPEQVARVQEFRARSTVGSFETEIPGATGDARPVRVLVYPFRQHNTRQHVIQLEDLADNWALRQKELEVERLQAVFGTAVAFHDKINTPLSIILAHRERLKYKWKAGLTWEDLEKSLNAVEHQVDKITEIVERMRDMKRYRVREYALRNVSMVDLSDSTDGESSEIS